MTLKVFQNSYSGEQSLVKIAHQIISMINELNLPCVPNFIALGISFLFGTEFFLNEETDTWFNVECVLLDRNFDFLGCYFVVAVRHLMVFTGSCLLPCGYYWWLLLLIARYFSFPLLVWANIESQFKSIFKKRITKSKHIFGFHSTYSWDLQINFKKSLDLGLKKLGIPYWVWIYFMTY